MQFVDLVRISWCYKIAIVWFTNCATLLFKNIYDPTLRIDQFYILRSQRLGLKHCGSRFHRKKLSGENHIASTSQHPPRSRWEDVLYITMKKRFYYHRRMYRLFMIRLSVPCIYIFIYLYNIINLFHHTNIWIDICVNNSRNCA